MKYTLEKILMDDGGWWISIFSIAPSEDVIQVVRTDGPTLEIALQNAKTEFNVYLESKYRIGKTFVSEIDKQIAEAQMGIE
jgi:predicted RNase H-like HicB family nuclease